MDTLRRSSSIIAKHDLYRAHHCNNNIYEAICEADNNLLRALIAVRGSQQLTRNVAVLHHAISDGNRSIVKLFLENGCDVNQRDTVYSKITPLMEAVRKVDLDICDILLEHKADIEAIDSSGENVMHWAARYTNGTFIKNFLSLAEKHGIQKHILIKLLLAPNTKKATPLTLANSTLTMKYMQQYLPWDHNRENNNRK